MPLRRRLALWYFLMFGSIGALNPWLAGVLEDHGQPRWATADERRALLTRLVEAAPPRP